MMVCRSNLWRLIAFQLGRNFPIKFRSRVMINFDKSFRSELHAQIQDALFLKLSP